MFKLTKKVIISGIVLITGFVILNIFLNLYPEYLWFASEGYSSVFFTQITAKITLFSGFTLITFIFVAGNFLIMQRILGSHNENGPFDILIDRLFPRKPFTYDAGAERMRNNFKRTSVTLAAVAILIFSILIGGLQGVTNWSTVLRFIHQAPSSVVDPIFGQSLSFYFFSLPFFSFITTYLLVIILLSLLFFFFLYSQYGLLKVSLAVFRNRKVKAHLLSLAALLFFVLAVRLWLNRYSILYSDGGSLFYGAGYTDIHANLLNYLILSILSALTGVLLLADIFFPTLKPVLFGVGAFIAAGIFFGGIYPEVLQNFVVKPSEYEKEQPYIQHNINFTRQAYGIDRVQERHFAAETNLTMQDIRENQEIIDNIRLWDEAPVLTTFAQLQAIRPYYEFNEVDVDRYQIGNKSQQVIISPRELEVDQISEKAQNWLNRKLQYTHGMGIVMSPVNKINEEGMPELYVKNIPPVSSIPYTVERPQIYFGESTDEYVVVNTAIKEFDYPSGDDNTYTRYQGRSGVPVDSIWRKLLFSAYFADKNILFSSYLTKGSKVLYHRDIMDRIRTVAPFITYDRDPYIVLAGGRLYWIIDGYSLSDRYPYSEPYARSINYIRNSVKVVVDAYDGTMDFYVVDDEEPIIKTYGNVFGNLFKPLTEMPRELQAHIRYPRDLFTIQAHMYRNYHMTNPRVFYNQEDVWAIPKERYEDNEILMEPYYISMKLPGEEDVSFLLMLPYTPLNKNNMISWLVVKNDPDNYGQLTVYKLAKDKQIFGPMQLESRIDQDTTISQQLTLWGQKGSRVIRGNLLVVPIEQSLMYVEPIYLQATASKMPQLKRVVVAYHNRVVMEETLNAAIARIFGRMEDRIQEGMAPGYESSAPIVEESRSLANKALRLYRDAQEYLKKGDWASYGNKLEELQKVLEELSGS